MVEQALSPANRFLWQQWHEFSLRATVKAIVHIPDGFLSHACVGRAGCGGGAGCRLRRARARNGASTTPKCRCWA